MTNKFDDLAIDAEFSAKGRRWKKKSNFAAVCLDKNAPFDSDTLIRFDRRDQVVPKKEKSTFDPNSIFRQRV
jgi:hypothetical protein